MARQIGRFLVYEEIGSWDAGSVFRAFEVRGLVRPAILKTLSPALRDRADCIEILMEEARIASELSHPNILRPLDVDEGDLGWYSAFERAQGRTLEGLMEESRQRGVGLDANAALHIVIQVLNGLAHAHEHTDAAGEPLEIVHRDLSPRNIWISYAGNVELGGFGYASMRGRTNLLTPGIDRPRLDYLSPEQASGERVDPRADVFSMGLILYELLAGKKAYDGSAIDVRAKARRAEVAPLRRVAPHTPASLERIVEGALTVDPSKRYPSASAFSDALVRFLVAHDATFGAKRFASALAILFGNVVRDERQKDDQIRAELFTQTEAARLLSFSSLQAFNEPSFSQPNASFRQLAGANTTANGHAHPHQAPQGQVHAQGQAHVQGGRNQPSPAAAVVPHGLGIANAVAHRETLASPVAGSPTSGLGMPFAPGTMPGTVPGTMSGPGAEAIGGTGAGGAGGAAGGTAPAPFRPKLLTAAFVVAGVFLLGLTVFSLSSAQNMRLVKSKFRAAFIGRKPGATLVIESIPPGAKIFIDEDDINKTTPLTVNNIESETDHLVRLELEGEKAVTETVNLRASDQRTITLVFKDAMVPLELRSEPAGAEVLINDRPAAQFTPLTMDVRVGQPIKLIVKREGYKPHEEAIEPRRGEPINLDIKLEKTAELLTAEAEEAAAIKDSEREGGEGEGGKDAASRKPRGKHRRRHP